MTNYRMKNRLQKNDRNGLILLVVLGMLAMFSLLAVTYVVSSSSSIMGSRALRVRDRNTAFDIRTIRTTDKVIAQVIRGSSNRDSIFFMNSLLGDVYGPDAIRSSFGPYLAANTVMHLTVGEADPQSSVNLIKVSLNPDAELNGPLSPLENEYNSRLLTVLEGPLSGNTFRIHKYVGHINNTNAATPDPNTLVNPAIPGVAGSLPEGPFGVPWAPGIYAAGDANGVNYANSVRYSIVIDLNEIVSPRVTGEVVRADGTFSSESRGISDWIATFGVQSLFFAQTTTGTSTPTNMVGYKFIINDAPFNYPGIGLEDVPLYSTATGMNSFGNLDARGLLLNQRVSPSLLTNYSYLNDPQLMRVNPHNGTTGVDSVGTRRMHHLESRLIGASNEGYDVPDWRDAWLAHQGHVNGVFLTTPSFHRPEVINHIAHLFGNPSSMTAQQVGEMLRLIQASTGRILNIDFGNIKSNTRFQMSNSDFPKYQTASWSSPPTAAEILALRGYVASLINGHSILDGTLATPVWDVDNDGDGVKESVWGDPGLDIVYAPDGRRLRPLMAVHIEDLDSRVNVNVAGDRAHGLANFATMPFQGVKRTANGISQGFGYGPAEISLNSFFMNGGNVATNLFHSTPNNFSFFDERYGARRYFGANRLPINYANPTLDRVPGRRLIGGLTGNDPISQVNEREQHDGHSPSKLPGMPMARRGSIGVGIDVFGNPVMAVPTPVGGDPYNYNGVPTDTNFASVLSEIVDDPYEINAMDPPNMDDPLGLEELEAVLRRFDADSSRLPDRLKKYLAEIPGYDPLMADINRQITTRSAELRYPNIAAAMKTVKNFGSGNVVAIESGAPSYMRYIQMLHSQRYRNRTFQQFSVGGGGSLAYADDPELSYAAISELFPVEFSSGLRMNLNRPFGNGFDNASLPGIVGGDVDEPYELQNFESEVHPGPGDTLINVTASYPSDSTEESLYGRELKQRQVSVDGSRSLPSPTRRMLAGRQILARNLYCLAQLLVPRDYNFPGMEGMAYRDGSGNINTTNFWPRAKIRARALAQWAVNVVDYRDADSAMTRFEYDILPFGTGTLVGGPAAPRPPYWAPDHVLETVNGVPNRVYCDVVWGVEFPELLLTESFAYHNKNLIDSNLDSTGRQSDPTNTMLDPRDPSLDQFRFMDAGLILELYNPRTVGSANDPTFTGTSGSLYTTVDGNRELDLGRLAPAPTGGTTPWGRQPVWRIAISEQYDAPGHSGGNYEEHPQFLFEDGNLHPYSLQHSTETVNGTPGARPANLGVGSMTTGMPNPPANVEQLLGNGLAHNPNEPTVLNANPATAAGTEAGFRMPVAFDRFIWFTPNRPGTGGVGDRIPDLAQTDVNRVRKHVYTPSAPASLGGGSYLVVGPKSDISFGSLRHNRYDGTPFPPFIDSAGTGYNDLFQLSPSYQGISLGSSFGVFDFMNREVNAPWKDLSKAPKGLVVRTDAPNDTWRTQGGRNLLFHDGVGINVSLPTPVEETTIWVDANRPTKPVNSADLIGRRSDNTPGYGNHESVPYDSYVDLANPASDRYPDTPIDRNNPLLVDPSKGIDRYRSGSYENVRAAYLQRLADPSLPYDPVMNPYITVDWISIDLTVFNGNVSEELDDRDALVTMHEPSPYTPPAKPNPIVFQSRYKNGRAGLNDNGQVGVNYLSPTTVWRPETGTRFVPQTAIPATARPNPADTSFQVNPSPYFNYALGREGLVNDWESPGASSTTFGYLNSGNVITTAPVTAEDTEPNNAAVSAASTVFDGFGRPIGNASPVYRGAGEMMANVFWTNRQFATPYELMLVPRSSPGQLGIEYGRYPDVTGAFNMRHSPAYLNSFQVTNPVHPGLAMPGVTPAPNSPLAWDAYDSYWAIPRHDPSVADNQWFADWPLLLEFVETEAPFADARKFFRPDATMSLALQSTDSGLLGFTRARLLNSFLPTGYYNALTAGNRPVMDSQSVRGPSFLAPFHYKSSYVAAGKINLNTITFNAMGQSRALKALEYLYLTDANRAQEYGPDTEALAAQFMDARRGYRHSEVIPNSFFGSIINPEMDPRVASRFTGAFVPALQSNFAPSAITTASTAADVNVNGVVRNQHPVDSTLLRADRVAPIPPINPATGIAPPSNDQLLIRRPGTADQVTQSNPFDNLQRVARLPNLTTNQSNVFAVWVTVGLFEYDPIEGFGEEYVTPTGGVQRERKFFIIDRTVPVGFKQGEDLNFRRTILLEREIP